jgi:hypothetical protein
MCVCGWTTAYTNKRPVWDANSGGGSGTGGLQVALGSNAAASGDLRTLAICCTQGEAESSWRIRGSADSAGVRIQSKARWQLTRCNRVGNRSKRRDEGVARIKIAENGEALRTIKSGDQNVVIAISYC